MKLLEKIRDRPCRRVIGLISGTSADGVDAALIAVEEDDGFAGMKLLHSLTHPYRR